MQKYKIKIKNFLNKNKKKHKCLCGCGSFIKIKSQHYYEGVPKFILGHQFKGKNNPNYKRVNKWIKKNKNKHTCSCGCGKYIKILKDHHWEGVPNYIVGHSPNFKTLRGKKNGMYGYKFNKKQKELQGHFHRGKTYEETYGKRRAKEIKAKCRLAQLKRYKDPKERLKVRNFGKANGMWCNGVSKLPYTYDFKRIAIKIRKKYKVCQVCNKKKDKKELPVHHINYNKQDNREINLIVLCCTCHNGTNGNRDYWFAYFCYIKNIEPKELVN